MDQRNRYLFRGFRRQYVAADLEEGKGEGGANNVAAWISNTLSESGYGGSDGRKEVGKVGEEEAPGGNKRELDEGKRNRLGENVEDGFGRSVGKGRAHVPNDAKDLMYVSKFF